MSTDQRFEYTGHLPVIFSDFTIAGDGPDEPGGNVIVERTVSEEDGVPEVGPAGSTLVAYPGDILHFPHGYAVPEHAFLVDLDPGGHVVSVAEIKAALDAAGVEYPSRAKRADLEALLEAHANESDPNANPAGAGEEE